tara:strand:- start:5049 stop:5492 length:444 start_codon:yes stop_codon:yes gene_type:complete
MAKIKMGRVGDRTPPPGFLSDLKAFDPDLRIRWSVPDQCWVVYQQVKRKELVGEYQGAMLSQVKMVDEPVLWVSDFTGEPDRRILEQLFKKRALDRKERLARAKRRALEKKKAKQDETAKKIDTVAPNIERGFHEIRKTVSPTVYHS